MLQRLMRIYMSAAQGRLEASNEPWAKGLLEVTHAGVVLGREAVRDRLPVHAAMLAYWTTTAIVPVFLLAFALTRPLGLVDKTEVAVREFVVERLVAGSATEVGTFLDSVLASANLRTMGLVGVVGLMVFGLQLYMRMERAYNDIFGVRVRRSILQRFIIFYSAITLGPVLIAGGFLAGARLDNASDSTLVSATVPLLFTATAFIGAIRALPCTKVRVSSCLAGGLVSAVGFEAAKMGFAAYTELFGTRDAMTVVYGSLGFLPVFLIWLNILWVVVLIGVEIAYIVEHRHALMAAQRQRASDPYAQRRSPDGFFALTVMGGVVERFAQGKGPCTVEQLSDELGANPHHVQSVFDVLVDAGLLAEAQPDGVLPSRPPESIQAGEVLRIWREYAAPLTKGHDASDQLVDRGLAALDEALSTPMANNLKPTEGK